MMNPLVVMSRLGRKGRSEGRRRIRDWWGGVGAGKGAKMCPFSRREDSPRKTVGRSTAAIRRSHGRHAHVHC